MSNYTVKVTWVENADGGNAACIGHDETVTIQAETPEAAVAEAVEAHEYAHDGDLGKYHPVAEIVEG